MVGRAGRGDRGAVSRLRDVRGAGRGAAGARTAALALVRQTLDSVAH